MAIEETLAAELSTAVDVAVSKPETEETKESESSANQDGSNEQEAVGDDGASDGGGSESDGGTETPAEGDGSGEDTDGTKSEVPPAKQPISDSVLTQAVQAGFSLEEARLFGSESVLKSAVNRVIEASKKNEPATELPEAEDIFKDLPKLDPESYEPEVIKAFESLTAVMKKQQEMIQGLQANNRNTMQLQQDAASHEVEQWFDKQITSLGDDFKDALGSGGYSSLDRASPQFAKREAIANQAAVLLAGYKAAGQNAPDRDSVFQAAAKLVLMDEFQKVREKKISKDLEKRSAQHINRASGGKQSGNKDPFEETASLLDAKYFSKK